MLGSGCDLTRLPLVDGDLLLHLVVSGGLVAGQALVFVEFSLRLGRAALQLLLSFSLIKIVDLLLLGFYLLLLVFEYDILGPSLDLLVFDILFCPSYLVCIHLFVVLSGCLQGFDLIRCVLLEL